jgi:hypothetical protein
VFLVVTRAEKTNQKHVSIYFHGFLSDEVMFLQKHALPLKSLIKPKNQLEY